MVCYKPLHAIKSSAGGRIKWDPTNARLFADGKPLISRPDNIQVPCGSCDGCREDYSRMWGTRCVHESSLFERNCFLTLTYSDEKLPKDMSLDKSHFPGFMKRLRAAFVPKIPEEFKDDEEFRDYFNFVHGIRYYHCGEYGDRTLRPHYHALLFNFSFDDKVFLKHTRKGYNLYTSDVLDCLWTHGQCYLGDVTFKSAAYVARYCMKKLTGQASRDFYGDSVPPYATMSRNPGIGRYWFDRHSKEVYPSDSVVLEGRQYKPPKYYDAQFERHSPESFLELKSSRLSKIDFSSDERSCRRLKVRETVKQGKLKSLDRM